MNKDVARAQADTLLTWADQWGRDDGSGSREVAFLLTRVAKLMGGTEDVAGVPAAAELPLAPVHSELTAD